MSQPTEHADNMPVPGPEARAHSRRLRELVAAEMASHGGAVPFRRYMELALYAPGLGYYASAGGAGLAAAADFVTAPEVSPLFARCLARQCAEVLEALGGGDVLEPGAGSGALAAELLAALDAAGRAPARYLILEVSAELQARQRETIAARVPHLVDRCAWLTGWPASFRGVVIANEVLDAMPVEGFRVTPDGIEQRLATVRDDALGDDWRPAPDEVASAVAHVESDLGRRLQPGYQSEYNPQLPAWFAGLAGCLEQGAALFIDYGYVRREYYLPERDQGTLVCTRAHRAHADPYDYPGLTDITAFVDFTAVTEAATAAGFELEGFTPQAHFLFATGLEDASAPDLEADDARTRLQASQQVKSLTLPGEMGERFNVIGFSRGLERPLSGFALNDLSRRL